MSINCCKRTLVVLVATPLLALAALLVLAMLAGGSAHGTLSSGRSVSAYSDSISLSATFNSDSAKIETGGKTIVVEPTRVIVDGAQVGNLDQDVVNVVVRVKRGTVRFLADGKPVLTRIR